MARINTNVGAVTAQRHLNTSYVALNGTLQRLSSGLRINRGADDPAGMIVSERLRAEISGVSQAIRNSQRASNVIATTEGALNEVASLLNSIQGLVVEAANTGAISDDEIKANQLQVDSAIASITRIANSTTFAGRQLLNGSLDYLTSGVDDAVLAGVRVNGALFGTRDYIPISVEVTTSAQPATLFYANSAVTSAVNIEVRGNTGVVTLQFGAGTSAAKMVEAINAASDATGVEATLSSTSAATSFRLRSTGFGSRQFVEVKPLPGSGPFALNDENGTQTERDEGRDVVAQVNGTQAIGEGLLITHRTGTLDLQLTIAADFGAGTTDFAINGGGSLFQVGGHVNSNEQVGIGVQSVAASRLGTSVIGFLSQVVTGESFDLSTEAGRAQASKIIDESSRQVAILRGRLGAFEKNTLDTNVAQLGITVENLTAAESSIRDADFAQETSNLTRSQILVSAGTSVLALANQTPQSVLRLLGG